MRRYVSTDAVTNARLMEAGVLDWREGATDGEAGDRVICADALAALNALPEASIACIITSPPYWNFVDYGYEGQIGAGSYEEYLGDLLRVWRAC